MPKLENLSLGDYRIQDRRGYEWGSNPVREGLAVAAGIPGAGTGELLKLLGLNTNDKAGVLENQLGLGDIPNASLPAQIRGTVSKIPDYFNEYVLGKDPEKSDLGELLLGYGHRRDADNRHQEAMGGKAWWEMTEDEKIKFLRSKGFE